MIVEECRHGRPECGCWTPRRVNHNEDSRKISHDHTKFFSSQPLSSGRWDAVGSWSDAVTETREEAFNWASNLDPKQLHWAVTVMAAEVNAFTLYERTAILEVIALMLGKEINDN